MKYHDKHQGRIVEVAVRKRGLSINKLADKLGVNRRSIYNWFHSDILKPEIISKIGAIINHNFSNEFSDIYPNYNFSLTPATNQLPSVPLPEIGLPLDFKSKYISLLEKYNNLLLEDLATENLNMSKLNNSSTLN